MKQLVVRADDLGYSEGISLGILAAHRDGIVTCTSVMVNMPYAKEAIEKAKEYPMLSLGLHVNVTNEYALSPKENIHDLVDEKGKFISSTIRRQQLKEGVALFSEEQAYMEAKAQVEKFIELTGYLPAYIALHVLEVQPLIDAICRVQKEYGIVHNPYLDTNFVKVFDQCMNQYTFYQENPQDMVDYFEKQHFVFHEPVSLFVCHPGFLDAYAYKTTSMLKDRVLDYALVTDPKVREWLQKKQIELVNFVTYKK